MAEETLDEQAQRIRVLNENAKARAKAFKARAAQALQSEQANTPTLKDDLLGRVAQGSRQIVRGAVGLADLPAAAVTGIQNIGANFRNASQPYGPREKIVTPQELFGGMQPTDLVDKYMPTVSGHENDVLNLPLEVGGALLAGGGFRGVPAAPARAGAVIPTLAAAPAATPGFLPVLGRGAQAFTGALARAGVRTGVTTGAMLAGKEGGGAAGRYIAETLGGQQYGDLGQHYGEVAGSFVGPAAVDVARVPAYHALNRAYTVPGDRTVPGSSARRLAALNEIGAGDAVSMGAVGNAAAQGLEDFTAGIPGGGRPAMSARERLYQALEQASTDVAANRRALAAGGGPPIPGTGRRIDVPNIGRQAIDTGIAAGDKITRDLNALYEDPNTGLHAMTDPTTGQVILPRETPSPPVVQRQTLAGLRTDPLIDQASQGPTIIDRQNALRTSSNQITDPAYERQLDARRATLDNNPTIDPATRAQIEEQIAAERAANRAPSFEAERIARAVNARTPEGVTLNRPMLKAARKAKDQDMRNTAVAAGIDPAAYDAVDAGARRLLGDRKAIKSLLPNRFKERPTPDVGARELFSKSGKKNTDQLRVLQQNAPGPLGMTFADQFELAARGPSSGTATMNPSIYDPAAVVKLWDDAPLETRDVYAPPGTPIRTAVEALVESARADTRRSGGRTKPGKGNNTLGGPQRYFQNPAALMGIGAGAGSLFGFPGLGAVLPLIPSAMARFVGNRFTNPRFVENVVHPPNLRGSLDLSRLLGAAVGGNAPDKPDIGQLLRDARQKAIDAAGSPLKTMGF